MKPLYTLIFTIFTFGTTLFAQQQWTQKDFKKLKHVVGSWESTTKTGFMQEKWVKKNDSTFTGQNYSINRGVSQLQEQLQLVFRNKEIHYLAAVRHQNKGLPVTFKLVSIKDDIYTFENKEHDFPQQIIYNFKNGKHIDVTISGPTENGPKTIEFHFAKRLR